jgi:hypothetical protein
MRTNRIKTERQKTSETLSPSANDQEGVIRVNISVPRKLKAEMDAVTLGINWSAVACEAFRSKLLELAARKEAKTKDEVISRLRAAAKLENSDFYQAGYQAGESWVNSAATPRELHALQGLANVKDDYLGLYGELTHQAGCGRIDNYADGLWKLMHPQKKLDKDAVRAYWERVLGEGGKEAIMDLHFLRGFLKGALEVWEQVHEQL